MIRAFFLNLLGGTFEVRLVKLLSGKKIPGTCLHSGSYFKARKVYRDKQLKYGTMVRLQAVTVLDHRINDIKPMTLEEAQQKQNVITNERLANVRERIEGKFPKAETMIVIDEASEVTPEVWDIAASNARQSEFMHKHQDEPNVDNEHDCDCDGPMDWSDKVSNYLPTCSVCGAMEYQEEVTT